MSGKRHNKNTDSGFVPIRRGIFEHINDGRMSGQEWMVYSILHLKADHLTGICYKISAPVLANLLQINARMVNRIMTKLEDKGYIHRLNHRGRVSFYPVVINKFLTSNGLLIDAHKTKSLNEIAVYTEEDCLLSVFQMSFKCLSNVPSTINIQELKNATIKNVADKKPAITKTSKMFSVDSIEFKLAKLLFDTIQQRKHDFKEPDLQKWAVHTDRMIRLDSRQPARIREVIQWAQKNDFWKDVILSTKNLRKHFDRLELETKKKGKRNNGSSRGTNRGSDPESNEPFIR